MPAPAEEKYYRDFLAVLDRKWRPAKAAFYALEAASSKFRLKAQLGFGRTDHLADRLGHSEPLVDYLYEHRRPAYFNSASLAGKLADLMAQAASTRMLLAPLYLDGQAVGIVDVREKAGRQAFSEEDVVEISDLLRRFAIELRRIGDVRLGGGVTLSTPAPPAESEPAPLPSAVARTARLVEETLARTPAPNAPTPGGGLSPREAEFVTLYLPTCLRYQEVEVAAVSSFVPGGATVTIAARRPLDPDIARALLESLEKVFAKTAVAFPFSSNPSWRSLCAPPADAPALRRAEIVSIQSSVLDDSPEGVVLFSLLFRPAPSPDAREALRSAHVVFRNVLAGARSEARLTEAYRGLVSKLLEPGLLKRAALKTHSFNVGRMARKLAARIGLAPAVVDQVTVAALLHDVGMRELGYDSLYTRRTLTDEEMALVRQHPRVGAFLVEDVSWPYPVAPLIRHHHERWDGGGYPDGLKGDAIPFGSRVIHLCEAFDALTSPTSYRSVLADHQALDILDSKAGTQFDPDLAPELKRMIEEESG